MGETNFTFGPIQKNYFFVLGFWPFFPRIRASQASFKAVLIAVYMTYGLQTKCKTCFGDLRMILYGFWKKHFFQRACRIILEPPKHVLHLVWSPFVIYTAIKTALKEAWEARFLGKRRSESKNENLNFGMGPKFGKCKISFTHLWSYFWKKKYWKSVYNRCASVIYTLWL